MEQSLGGADAKNIEAITSLSLVLLELSLIKYGFLMSECVLFYAKYSIDRKKQIKHIGTYFGDSGTVEDVKKLGVNIRKLDTTVIIIPKIYDFNDTLDTIALDAQEYFEQFGQKLQEQQE